MPNEILVLAQSEPLVHTLVTRLREQGQNVIATPSVQEALMALRDVPIEIALIESSLLSETDELRSQVLALRPSCQLITVDSFEEAKRSGSLLEFGRPDYILRGSDLIRLIAAARRHDDPSRELERQRQYTEALVKVLDVLVGLQEVDDKYFAGFTKQVTRLACAVAEGMRLPPEAREEIVIASFLRDIGKVGVRPDLLSEPDKYTGEEFDKVRAHVLWSVRLFEHIQFPGKVLAIIRHHHERYDGTGYPAGLKGRQIPLGSRIITAAECFVAMLSDRPHRPARTQEKAIEELMSVAGTQLDPEVVEVLLTVLRNGPGMMKRSSLILVVEPDKEFRRFVRMRLLNDGHEVVVTDQVTGEINSLVARTPDLVLFATTNGAGEAFQCMDRLSVAEGGNRVPLALLVAEDSREFRLLALRRGVDDFILKSDDMEEISARVANILMREAARNRAPDTTPIGVRGHLGNLSLPDIIQMLCMGQKTAAVTLTSPRGTSGVWFRDGAIIHAECGVLRGEEAFKELMGWEDGEFLIQHGVEPSERSIEADSMFLLMEHFRRLDEGEKARSEKPSTRDLSFELSDLRLP